MKRRLPLDIELDVTMRRQPSETTCGPTCLHAVYDYYQDAIPLEQVIEESQTIDSGGTLPHFSAVMHCSAAIPRRCTRGI